MIVPRHARDSSRSGQSLSERLTGLYNTTVASKNTQGASRPNGDTKYTSWDVGGPRPVAGVQIWAKPLGGGKTAALFINGGATNTSANITLAELNITASTATVTDVWTGEVLAQNSSPACTY